MGQSSLPSAYVKSGARLSPRRTRQYIVVSTATSTFNIDAKPVDRPVGTEYGARHFGDTLNLPLPRIDIPYSGRCLIDSH